MDIDYTNALRNDERVMDDIELGETPDGLAVSGMKPRLSKEDNRLKIKEMMQNLSSLDDEMKASARQHPSEDE